MCFQHEAPVQLERSGKPTARGGDGLERPRTHGRQGRMLANAWATGNPKSETASRGAKRVAPESMWQCAPRSNDDSCDASGRPMETSRRIDKPLGKSTLKAASGGTRGCSITMLLPSRQACSLSMRVETTRCHPGWLTTGGCSCLALRVAAPRAWRHLRALQHLCKLIHALVRARFGRAHTARRRGLSMAPLAAVPNVPSGVSPLDAPFPRRGAVALAMPSSCSRREALAPSFHNYGGAVSVRLRDFTGFDKLQGMRFGSTVAPQQWGPAIRGHARRSASLSEVRRRRARLILPVVGLRHFQGELSEVLWCRRAR